MKVSLIMATIGREKEVLAFIHSLLDQTQPCHEFIIVEQNENQLLRPIVDRFKNRLPLVYLPCKEQGLSLARNIGIQHATGDILCFPDDDCLYPPTLLAGIIAIFSEKKLIHAVSTCWRDDKSNKRVGRFGIRPEWINERTIWTQVSSITLFIRREFFQKYGGFDEELGIGPHSIWKGAEDKDIPIRILRAGKLIWYEPSLFVLHAAPTIRVETKKNEQDLLKKTYQYSAAAGFVMRKHRYPFYVKAVSILVIIAKLILHGLTFNRLGSATRWAALKGRIHGLFYSPERGS